MRLQQYINESEMSIEEINTLIHKKCKPYLKLIKGEYPLYRGMDTGYSLKGIKDVRTDRHSKGMSTNNFNILNSWLKKNGHAERSKSVISTSDKNFADYHGTVHYIFPMGKFKYTYIEAKDLNIDYPNTGWDVDVIGYFEMGIDNEVKDYFHTDKGFKIAYKNKYEIWFESKQYIYADTFYDWDISKEVLVKNET